MELKVWVEGMQRIVCGVTETTTCQDVVFALAHATGKVGRFTLIEKWRNNERMLAPNETPLKILIKWGEYSSDVQFVLQRSDQQPQQASAAAGQQQQQLQQPSTAGRRIPPLSLPASIARNSTAAAASVAAASAAPSAASPMSPRSPKSPKSLADNVGIVRGIPQSPPEPELLERNNNQQQQQQKQHSSRHQPDPSWSSTASSTATTLSLASSTSLSNHSGSGSIQPASLQQPPPPPQPPQLSPACIEFNTADVRSSLDRKTTSPSASASENSSNSPTSAATQLSQLYAGGPVISANGALVPPPYRDPPPPLGRSSATTAAASSPTPANSGGGTSSSSAAIDALLHSALLQHSVAHNAPTAMLVQVKDVQQREREQQQPDGGGVIFHSAQYRELVQLIKLQREKLSVQQMDLGKFDAEIGYLEQQQQQQQQQLDAGGQQQLAAAERVFRAGAEQLQQLQYVEEENELVHQQEKTLKSEITLLRSKLANCETELLQYRNRVRMLLDDIHVEQRAEASTATATAATAAGVERHFMGEVERIQAEIDQAVRMAETAHQTADHLRQEVAGIEGAIAEKKKQVERLVNEMKEVNLQSLTAVAPASEEIRHLLEGSSRPGSTRRIIGSPRQLENAVPTSKNPHGVWV